MEEKILETQAPVVVAAEENKALAEMTEREMQAVQELSAKIDITDAQQVLQYGTAAQSGIAEFSESALGSAKGRELGEVGDMIGELMAELKEFDAEEAGKGGLFGLFRRAGRRLEVLRTKYDEAADSVDRIAGKLEKHQVTLMKDMEIQEQMYDKNLEYFKKLTIYIEAGKMRLQKERETTLAAMREVAKRTELPQDAQRAKDFEDQCLRFERKIYDLELTRNICLQMGPQIRLLQNNNSALVEKIQSSLLNTIPLWKNQMVLALGLNHSKMAMEAQRSVTDMTNDLLKKNAETLKTATIETAKETERGIVDIETLQATNESLITTLDEVLRIQDEGKQKRRAAEAELQRIEGELKQKLLEVQNA